MTKTAMVAHLVAKPENHDEVEAALRALVESTMDESGTVMYVLNRDANDEHSFWFYELYADADALATHGGGPGMAAAMVALDHKLAEAPMLTQVEPLAAKGLTL